MRTSKALVAIGAALSLAAAVLAAHHNYTRDELERMSKERLINIILELQGDPDGGGSCRWFHPLNGERPRVLTRVNNPGWSNDGTLLWPGGQKFLLRNEGWSNDRTLHYPNGKTMVLRNSGWSNDGTIHRADGSVWLRRNRRWSDDRQRFGLPIERFNDSGLTVGANLEDDDTVTADVRSFGAGWSITVRLQSGGNIVPVQECLERSRGLARLPVGS